MSDTGLLEVARRCSSLTALELSRSELPFKVGDVTLMVRTTPLALDYVVRFSLCWYCRLPRTVNQTLFNVVILSKSMPRRIRGDQP